MQVIPCAIDGEIFEHQDLCGVTRRYRLNIEDDNDAGAPWEECDGHGIVSDWTTRDKRPGERVLNTDRSSKRYYDVQASQKIALRDAWGGEGKTKREQAAHAVARDFDYLRAWCNDEWRYVGVIVTLLSDDPEEDDTTPTDYAHAYWGVESEAEDYIKDLALELARDISEELANKPKPHQTWKTQCGHGRATYRPDWSRLEPFVTYIDGTAGRHFASLEACAQYFAAKGMYLNQGAK